MTNVRQRIHFCTAPDGVRLAHATAGDGPPLVRVSTYMTHLEYDWDSPVWRHWLGDLSRHHTLIRYDQRGCGLSDRNVADFSIEAWVRDLETVVDSLGLERFALLGPSQGGAVAIAYANRHPHRVSHLILYGAYLQGRFRRAPSPADLREGQALIDLMRAGWGRDNPAFRQVFSTLFMPEGSPEQIGWFNELQRLSTSPENAARIERTVYGIDVRDLAPKVRVPAMVLHARGDAMIPFEEGRRLAAMIPGARFVPLVSNNHLLLADEPAWRDFLTAVEGFLEERGDASPRPETGTRPALFDTLTPREWDVLEEMARGFDNGQIAERLGIRAKTVRNHVSNIYDKLRVSTRARAVIAAREAGLGRGER